jgi:predicted N-acetyltransferase YhbS
MIMRFLTTTFIIFVQCGVAMANGSLCNRLLNQLSEGRQTYLVNDSAVTIRAALPSDVAPVTDLIHLSFQVWAKEGLRLSPMAQTQAETSTHLLEKGFVATDKNNRVVGTFSVDDGQITSTSEGELTYLEGNESTSFKSTTNTVIKRGKYLVFKKLAVDPSIGRSGLGRFLYQTAEKMARANGYSGMILETVREATWLFHWYENLGFSVIGSHRYPGSQVDTLLMIKNF